MKKHIFLGVLIMSSNASQTIKLPHIQESGPVSVEKAIKDRRSVRSYKKESLTLQELSQLLWAAQGITDKSRELRAAPSAGALYPLELYVVVGNVEGLHPGVYKYAIGKHELTKICDGNKRNQLMGAALSQSCVGDAPASIVICGIYERISRKYGKKRAPQYVYIEVGAVAENLYLQGRALNIGTVFVGAFDDAQVQRIIEAQSDEKPLAILPVGKI